MTRIRAREVAALSAMEVCAGIGGLTLGLEMAGFGTAALAEIDPRCRAHLREKWPDVSVFADFTAIADDDLRRAGRVDLLAGGIPCQPWSVAGQQRGSDDERDLWPAFFALAQRLSAAILVENVPGLASDPRGLDRIAGDLEREGYLWWSCSVRAADVGAPHLRDRLFICAVADQSSLGRREGRPEPTGQQGRPDAAERQPARSLADGDRDGQREQRQARPGAGLASGHDPDGRGHDDALAEAADAQLAAAERGGAVGDAEQQRPDGFALDAGRHVLDRCQAGRTQGASRPALASPWAGAVPILCRDGKHRLVPPEPALFPLAHGTAGRVARLRAVGNAVVPLQAYVAARTLYEELTARSLAA